MRTAMTAGALSLAMALGLGLLRPPRAAEAEDKPEPEVARMFKHRCASCHAVPDPDVRTDRAWLDQVKRTA